MMWFSYATSDQFGSALASQPNVQQSIAVDMCELVSITLKSDSTETMYCPLHAGHS